MYVDDTTTGCNSVEEGKRFHEVSVKLMKEAGFDLKKWITNDDQLQRFFDRGKDCVKTIGDDVTFAKSQVAGMSDGNSNHKVLGIEWDRSSDDLLFDFKEFIKKI